MTKSKPHASNAPFKTHQSRYPVTPLTKCSKPGVWHYDGSVVPPHVPGPKAFYVRMPLGLGLACDPDLRVEHNSHVVLLHEGEYSFQGIVKTKHPAKTKTLLISGLLFNKREDRPDWTVARVFAVHVPTDGSVAL